MSVKQKVGLWILAIAVGLLLFITFAVPQIGKYYAQRWVTDQGAEQAQITSVRFNPFLGRVALENLNYQFPDAEPVSIAALSLEMRWRSLWSRRIHLTSVQLTKANTPVSISNEKIALGELVVWQAAEDDSQVEPSQEETQGKLWHVQVDSVQLNEWQLPIALFGTETHIYIESLFAKELDTSAIEQPVHIEFSGDVNQDPVKWVTDITAFADQPMITGSWQFDEVDLARFAPLMGEGMAQLRGVLAGNTDLRVLIKEQGVEINQDGELSLSSFNLPGILQSESLVWSGKTSLALTLDDAVGSLSINGDLASQQLQPTLHAMKISVGDAHWNGELSMLALNDVETLTTTSALDVKQLSVSDSVNEQSVNLATLKGIQINPGLLVAVEDVSLDEIVLTTEQYPDADLAMQQIRVSGVQYSTDGVKIQGSRINDMVLSIVRDPQGNWQLPYAAVQEGKTEEAESGSQSMPVQVADFRLTGSNKIVLDDRSVSPAAKNTLRVDALSIKDVATKNKTKWSPFELVIKHGEYGTLSFDGKLRNPGDEMDLVLASDIKQLDLPSWSSYLVSATGYQVKHGVLDSTLDVKVDQGNLDATTEWLLHNLAVERADDEIARQMEASMSMPLDAALSMLRDGDDNIKLKIPVAGDLRSPDFDISSVMNKAIATALKKTTMTYLKYALQPYGALLLIGEAVGSQAGGVKFAPVEFASLQSELSAESVDYLTKIGELLQQRPNMRIKICGFSTWADLSDKQRKQFEKQAVEKPVLEDTDKAALQELASQRASSVKQRIVEGYGIQPERLFTCLPKLELAPDALPRVELGL